MKRIPSFNGIPLDILCTLNESSIISITDSKGIISFVNDPFCKISKYSQEELIGINHRMLNSGHHSEDFFIKLWKTIGHGDVWKNEIKNKAKDGTFYWVLTTITPFLYEDRKPYHYVSIQTDITIRKQAEESLKHIIDKLANSNKELWELNAAFDDEENNKGLHDMEKLIYRFNEMMDNVNQSRKKIEHQAYHDSLTGLPNRYKIEEYFKTALNQSKKRQQSLALLFLDLDEFKMINDMMGHHVGDLLLKEVAEKLTKSIHGKGMVARQGGDEFLLLLEDTNEHETMLVAQSILDHLSAPFIFEGQEFFTYPSIGISMYPKDGEIIENIIKQADTAMYIAKKLGKNNFQFYTKEPNNNISRKQRLENGLRKALVNNEFILHYQPQIDLKSGHLRGLEVLIRWDHPEFGITSPNEFIQLAEETTMINEIGNWVITKACKQNKKWQEAGFPHIPIAVNVSPSQFKDKNFVPNLIRVLKETKLEPQYLELEITESTIYDFALAIETLHIIKQYNIKVSIDDFGIGYSSLSMLDHCPIDTLKIDRSFIKDLISNSKKAAIVKMIIDLAHNLNFQIVAEGIETSEQANILKQYNCHIGQGLLFHPPLTAENVEILYWSHDMSL